MMCETGETELSIASIYEKGRYIKISKYPFHSNVNKNECFLSKA